MSITIKPCPFCGYDDVEIDEVGIGEFAIDCPECRAIGPIVDTVMEAISFWNDRRGEVVHNASFRGGSEARPAGNDS